MFNFNKPYNYNKNFIKFWSDLKDKEEEIKKNINNFDEIVTIFKKIQSDNGLDLAWRMGGDKDEIELVLSSEGDILKRIILEQLFKFKPANLKIRAVLNKQPNPKFKDAGIKLGDNKINFSDFKLNSKYNEEVQLEDIVLYHPLFEELDQNAKFQITFLMLDDLLGEENVSLAIGEIKFGTKEECNDEIIVLRERAQKVLKEKDVKSLLELFTLYSVNQGNFRTKQNVNMGKIISNRLIDPNFSYSNYTNLKLHTVRFDTKISLIDHIDELNKVLDEIRNKIELSSSAIKIGEAIGENLLYVDFAVFDKKNFDQELKNIDIKNVKFKSVLNY